MDKPKSGLLIIAGEPQKRELPPLKPMKGMTSDEHSEMEKDNPEEKAEKPLYEMADLLRARLCPECDPADYGGILKSLKSHINDIEGGEEEAEEPAEEMPEEAPSKPFPPKGKSEEAY